MDKKALVPSNILQIKGKLSYSESLGAWNTLRFRSELVKEFPQLSDKRARILYKLVFYRSVEEFEKAMKELKNNKDAVMPVLLWLYKDIV